MGGHPHPRRAWRVSTCLEAPGAGEWLSRATFGQILQIRGFRKTINQLKNYSSLFPIKSLLLKSQVCDFKCVCVHTWDKGRGGETHCVGSQGLPPLFLAPSHFQHSWMGYIGDHVSCNIIVSFCAQMAQRFRIWSGWDQTLCEAQRERQCCEEHHLQSQLCAR